VDAIGWVLLGFILGSGAAIAVLMNADIVRRGSADRTPEAAITGAPHVRLDLAPAQAPVPFAIARPVEPVPVLALVPPAGQAAPSSPAPAQTAAKAPGKTAIRPAPVSAGPQMVEDAAATGMTSHVESRPTDLY
jgi:hypothetical protein